jgi:hypothetical protein
MKSGLEEALLSSMPQDVTSEEIAAIKAAGAACSVPSDESSFTSLRARGQSQQPVAKPEELPRESGSESIALVQPEFSVTTEQATIAESVSAGEVPIEPVPPPVTSESSTPPSTEADKSKLADDEVTAALASLAPKNGHGDMAAIPVTMAAADATEEFSGPRWIAESVPLKEDEATLVLEQEMEKAYAAFAAADAVRMSFVSSPDAFGPLVPVAEAPASDSETSSSVVDSFANSDSSESRPPDAWANTSGSSTESGPSESEVSPVAASPAIDAVSQSFSEVQESAAYAAAASASSSTAEVTMGAEATSPVSPVAEPSESGGTDASARHGEPEIASAWTNWKQIRESVIGSQVSEPQANSQIAESVAEFKESSTEAQQEFQPDASPATEEESKEISNIVDSVLADLKPKLMAEIARKMGKEKKK